LKFGKKSPLAEAEELETEPKKKDMTVLNLTEGLGLTEAEIKVPEGIESNEKGAAKSRQGFMGILACYEEILKEKQTTSPVVLHFFKPSSGTYSSSHYCWTLERMNQVTCLQFNLKLLLVELFVMAHFSNFS
jgi:hypothetical protein